MTFFASFYHKTGSHYTKLWLINVLKIILRLIPIKFETLKPPTVHIIKHNNFPYVSTEMYPLQELLLQEA
jgi:hypothetical protein